MARALDQNYFLNSPRFRASHGELHNNDISVEAERYSKLTDGLQGDISFFSSPGRAELIAINRPQQRLCWRRLDLTQLRRWSSR